MSTNKGVFLGPYSVDGESHFAARRPQNLDCSFRLVLMQSHSFGYSLSLMS